MWYTTQVNRQNLNEIMDALKKANEDMNILCNITDIITQHFRYHQIYTYANNILAHLRNCLTFMRQVTTHTMVYVDAAMTNILSHHLPLSCLCCAFWLFISCSIAWCMGSHLKSRPRHQRSWLTTSRFILDFVVHSSSKYKTITKEEKDCKGAYAINTCSTKLLNLYMYWNHTDPYKKH